MKIETITKYKVGDVEFSNIYGAENYIKEEPIRAANQKFFQETDLKYVPVSYKHWDTQYYGIIEPYKSCRNHKILGTELRESDCDELRIVSSDSFVEAFKKRMIWGFPCEKVITAALYVNSSALGKMNIEELSELLYKWDALRNSWNT